MRLTAQQIKVLAAAQLDARATSAELAKRTGLPKHTAQRAMSYLLSHELVHPYCVTNISALGYIDYAIFIRRLTESEQGRRKLIEQLRRARQVSWLVEAGGEFQYAISVNARSLREIDDFLLRLNGVAGQAIKGRSISARIRCETYALRLPELPNSVKLPPAIASSAATTMSALDKTDHEILRALGKDALLPYSTLARTLDIPNSSFQYRLKRLLQDRVILGFALHINYAALGLRKYMLFITERNSDRQFCAQFEKYCRNHPSITAIVRALGEWNYEIDVHTQSGQELSDVRQEILEKFGESIADIETVEYLRTHKLFPYPGPSLDFSQVAAAKS